jgi:hypothetical protein
VYLSTLVRSQLRLKSDVIPLKNSLSYTLPFQARRSQGIIFGFLVSIPTWTTSWLATMGTRNLQDTPSSKAAKDVQQVRLHSEADAILAVQGDTASELPRKEPLVSSAVLMAASDYFRTLFRSGFKEGVETRRGDCPTIVMAEDDPKAMQNTALNPSVSRPRGLR